MKKEAIIELSHRMIPGKENFRLETRTFDVTELLPKIKHRPDIWYVLRAYPNNPAQRYVITTQTK